MSAKDHIKTLLGTGLLVSFNMLVAFAGPLLKYDITRFGAEGDGKTLNTLFIQAAIDQCSKNGGGVVIIPAEKFITGAIFLKQGVNLNIEKNGVLKGLGYKGLGNINSAIANLKKAVELSVINLWAKSELQNL
jgi:hypothetical protein